VSTGEKTPVQRTSGTSFLWTLAGTALFAMIVVLVNYISFRRFERWDLTSDGLYTLSGRTDELLKGLDKPVDIYLFMSAGEPNFQDMKELISRYRAKSDKITAHFVDPDREPSKFRMLAERFGVRVALAENGQTEAELAALVTSGDKRWSITRDDLVNLDMDSMGDGPSEAKIDVKTEQALSGAIVQVTSGRATKVCFSSGHGEWALDAADRSLSALREELKRENIEFEVLETRGKEEIPKTCDALFVLGPQKAFSEEESAVLKGYLEQGGNLLLALDPVISGDQLVATGLENLTSAYGVKVDADVLVELDAQRLLTPSPVEAFLVTSFGDHVTTKPLSVLGAPVVMQLARTLSVAEGSQAEVLMRSSDKAYGESQIAQLTAGDELKPGDGDVKGPAALAVAVTTRKQAEGDKKAPQGGRLIVMGDSDWVAPELLTQPQVANVDWLGSVTGFLTQRDTLISIAPRKLNARSVLITEDGLFGIFLRVVVLMPLAALVLGLGVWWQRRA
jgi:ABC-type uncharacterized transport system involved in gliding motility auxiliary subunit